MIRNDGIKEKKKSL